MTLEDLIKVVNGLPKDTPVLVRNSAGDVDYAEEVILKECTSSVPKKCWIEIHIK